MRYLTLSALFLAAVVALFSEPEHSAVHYNAILLGSKTVGILLVILIAVLFRRWRGKLPLIDKYVEED